MQRTSVKETLKIALTFSGTIIGAGFASGQELLQFFITYGSFGLYGILFAGILFAWLGYRLLSISYRYQLSSYPELIYKLCGKKLGLFFDGAISFFIFTVLVIMLAAASTLHAYGSYILAVLITVLSLKGIKGITIINLLATPFLTFAILSVSFSSLAYHGNFFTIFSTAAEFSLQPAPHWLLSCILYVSYNIVLAMTILIPLGQSTPSETARKLGTLIGGILLTFLAFLIVCTILIHYPDILTTEIPMLTIACTQTKMHSLFYTIIFLISIFTTSLSCLYGCATKLKSIFKLSYPICLLVSITASLIFIQIGFKDLIAIAFPIFGYTTLWILFKIIFSK
ncbi:YkvI family membrane protein [Anaerosinus massiliensis]|uniref:YkvI family membrane protein n=1 Tax=Massilibacillus massiliensis TaxID=1806837 RepID=UPI000DA5FCB6|nr:hypothetical protein [Massilibacillus massiliensis]